MYWVSLLRIMKMQRANRINHLDCLLYGRKSLTWATKRFFVPSNIMPSLTWFDYSVVATLWQVTWHGNDQRAGINEVTLVPLKGYITVADDVEMITQQWEQNIPVLLYLVSYSRYSWSKVTYFSRYTLLLQSFHWL